MADTYTQIHIQVVFAVKFRNALIDANWKGELYRYITGIVHARNHRLLAINGMADHIHILLGMRPVQSISELVQEIKSNSSRWINAQKKSKFRFEWQEGFGAFSYRKIDLPTIIAYILNQEKHHEKIQFLDEYENLLKEFEIGYKQDFVFRAPE
jgi:REP element-mobilizing transposase RayT